MRKPRPSRYQQLSDSRLNALRSPADNLVIRSEVFSYLGNPNNVDDYIKSLRSFEQTVHGWMGAQQFTYAFVKWCNSPIRQSRRNFETAHSQFKNGFAQFLVSQKLHTSPLSCIGTHTIKQFVMWLKNNASTKKGKRLNANSQRRYYGIAKSLLMELLSDDLTKPLMSGNIAFPDNPFPEAEAATKATVVYDDHIWRQLIEACRSEIRDVREEVESGWKILDSSETQPDESRRGRGRYSSREAALWRAKRLFPEMIPGLNDVRVVDRDLAEAMHHIHGQASITRPFYPLVGDILPFVLLYSVYTNANTGPLRNLKHTDTKVIDVMGVDRISYTFEKPRAHSQYRRSFALQTEDFYSPYEIYLFLSRWTAGVRPFAGKFKDHVFIFVTNLRKVRAFTTVSDTGRDSDSSWNFAIKQFVAKYNLPHVTVSAIRNTGLDMVRFLTGDDMRAIQAIGGQKSQGTIQLHYNGAAAKRRRNEELSEVMLAYERWAKTNGRTDSRRAPASADILAATPGWLCLNPLDSPIPGESKGALCQALGRCPACPLASVSTKSSHSLGRILQLIEEVRLAQTYLDGARWKAAYEPVLVALLTKWLPAFTSTEVQRKAASLNLPPIGALD